MDIKTDLQEDAIRALFDTFKKKEEEAFIGGFTVNESKWQEPLTLDKLTEYVKQLQHMPPRPTLYVETADSLWLANLIQHTSSMCGTPLHTTFFMDIKEAPILAWGDLPRGLYSNGTDYFFIEGKINEIRVYGR